MKTASRVAHRRLMPPTGIKIRHLARVSQFKHQTAGPGADRGVLIRAVSAVMTLLRS